MAPSDEGEPIRHDPGGVGEIPGPIDPAGSSRNPSEWLRFALSSIGDAVIGTDPGGQVTFLNEAAGVLTGWTEAEAVGRRLAEVFRAVDEVDGRPIPDPTPRALLGGPGAEPERGAILIDRGGGRRPIEASVAALRDGSGETIGVVLVFRDVSERRRAEESRARLAAIVESSDDAIISKTLEGIIQSWNAGAERLFGHRAEEAIGRPMTLIIPADRQDEEKTILSRLCRGEKIEHFETIRVTRDGRLLDISLTVSPVRAPDGRIIGASKVARDITERKRGEQERKRLLDEVEAERSRLSEVFRRAPSFLAMLRGPDHVFEMANDRYYELIGDREILGRPVREAVPEAVDQGFMQVLDGVFRTGETFASPETRILLRRQPGRPLEERFIEFVYQPLRDSSGAVSGILAQGIDLTERKRAQAAVRERDERLRLFLENATDYAVVITDELGRILEWKGGAEQITGWTETEILGRSAAVLFTPEDRAAGAPRDELRRAVEAGRAEDKRWHLRKDGSRFFGDGVMTCLRGPDGQVRGFGKVVRDVTDRKRAEEALREADRRKDEFIALLAHELRNPLAPIRNGLQVMRLAGDDPQVIAEARSMMDRQLGHMVRLIDDLLDVSRIGQNKMELRRTRVLLADVVSNAVETARPAIDAAGHDLAITLPAAPLALDADLTRLAQVLSNLLANSAKYTEPGGRIWLAAERVGGEAVITVRDDGIGIPAGAQARVFEMFSQVEPTLERSGGGLGIGLALVKGLVEMHGGSVSVESGGRGLGSTFTVRLPALGPAEAPATGPGPEGDRPARSRRKVLVVDDNQDSARTMARVLGLLGNETRMAHDGVEAIEAAERFRPEVILMDVGMPRMSGLDATRQIRARDWGRSTIIVALTGWGQEGDRVRSREAGCDGHLVKPVDLAEMERLIDRLAPEPEAARVGNPAALPR